MHSVNKIKKIIFILGVLTIVFPLLPQTAQAVSATPQRGLDAEAATNACITYGAGSQQCKDAQAKADATAKAELNGGDSGIGSTLGYYIAQVIYVFTVGLGSAVAAIAANILNYAVSISLDSAAYGLDFVSQGWTAVRDLANMAFIFILVYIAMKVMFEAHTAGTMGLLAKVLAVALVINFSFFATRVVIDAGNLISVQFYNAVVAQAPDATINPVAGVSSGVSVPDITKKIMAGINFQSALSPDSFKNVTGNDVGDFVASLIAYSLIYIVLGAMLFMIAAAFVAAGIKFIIRIVMLWFSIISAPLALVAWSFGGGGGHGGHGGGGGYFTTWRKNLISHAFYPAVFLFILLLISNFMSASGLAGFGGDLVNGSINPTTSGIPGLAILLANIAVRLTFVLVMLYAALKASDYFEVAGASVAKQVGDTFSLGGAQGYGRMLSRIGGGAVNRTAGRTAFSLNNALTNTRFGQDKIGSTLRKGVLKPVADASVGGAKSFTKLVEEKKTFDKEYKTGIRDIDTHELVHTVAHSGTATDEQVKKLQKLSKREIEHLGEDDMKAISGFLTEDQMKIVRGTDGFTEPAKEKADSNWQEKSSSAPLQKTEKLVEEIEKTNNALGDIKYTISNQTYKLSDLLKSGSKINKTNLIQMKEAFSQKAEEAKTDKEHAQAKLTDAVRRGNSNDADAAKILIRGAQAIERNASDAFKKVEKATEDIGKIPANPESGRNTGGEFTKK